MFGPSRDRSRARSRRLVTVVTLVALVFGAYGAGITPAPVSSAAAATPSGGTPSLRQTAYTGDERGVCVEQIDCPEITGFDPDYDGPAGGQAETSIAVDSTGQHIVVGINDTRGFSLNPTSVSGFQYSDDGGATFSDGGLLPVTVATSAIGATLYPQAFGDPEVKYLGGSTFIYVEIMVRTIAGPGGTGTAQTMGYHISRDNGHIWTGPYEITSATNPNGLFSGNNARDAADKEFVDVDPETGRVTMSWSNFTTTTIAPGGVQISTTYSDNILTTTPATWSPRAVVAATASDGQASIPRFAAGPNSRAYVAWRRFPGGLTQNVGFARSSDNGASWLAPTNLAPTNFFTMDQVLGNDRNNTSPSLAVDTSSGPSAGNVYVVYANNDSHDGGDVAFQRSTDTGLTWSAPVMLNSRPGADRAQWFPWITVDPSSGRIYVFYYDQGIATSGDKTEVTYLFSGDGGVTWSRPVPLTDRPFRAGWGNDTGQPNIGDYNQAVAQNGELFVVWAGTELKPFTDGQPSASFTTPDVFFKRVTGAPQASLRLSSVLASDSGGNGNIDPGEQIALTVGLENYVTNPMTAGTITGISVTLTTTTPNVTVTSGAVAYSNIAPGASLLNTSAPFVFQTSAAFVPGTKIELAFNVSTAQGPTTLRSMQLTGTPSATTFFSENFNGVAAGSLPAGWSAVHSTFPNPPTAGTNAVPWTTNNSFCGTTSNAAFHQNAQDGITPTSTAVRFERLFSPTVTVPAGGDYVTLDFDVCYDTEDDPSFNVQAYDGLTLRITDLTAGRTLRSVLVEAFEDDMRTGSSFGFPKHLPRSSNANYLQDMSVWAGYSGGFQHVSMRLYGMAGSSIQLRWEYTQDSIGTCVDVRPGHACGVSVDNIFMKSVRSVATTVAITSPADGTLTSSSTITVTGTQSLATSVRVNGVAATITGGTWTAVVPLAEGSNLLTATATGPSGTATASVTVRRDSTPPVLTPPAAQTAEATSAAGAAVGYPPCTATDASTVTITYDKASGSTFPIGTTTVTCTATDAAGNTSTASFTVTVRDTIAPVVTTPGDQTAEATSAYGALVTYPPCTATDAVSTPVLTYSQNSGTQFALGMTIVFCTATDAAGNHADGTFVVTVQDTIPPVVTAPADQTIEATSPSGAVATYACTATDAVSSPTVAYTPPSGSTFPLGTSTVTCRATDAAGNHSDATFAITVRDTTPPAVTAPADQTAEATSPAGAVGAYPPCTATDAASTPTLIYSKASGSTFPLGATIVTCTATDGAGLSSSASFTVTVRDTTPPSVTAPADQTAEATSSAGAAVAYPACAATDIAGPVTITYSKASGSTFPLGATIVTCTATDGAALSSSASFTVTVRDTTPPSVTAPADQIAEATSPAGALVTYPPCTATDAASTPTLTYSKASGSTFPLGATIVTCTATDGAGLTTSASFTITVRDTTPPSVTAPPDQTAEATSPAGAPVTYPPCIATDAVSTPIVTYSSASGTTFPLGATTVTCRATDAAGNHSDATFTISVHDTTPPSVAAPADQTAEATSPAGAVVPYPPCTATDAASVPTITYSKASGTMFPLGATTVTCTATDGAGLSSSANFTITVRDTTPPTVTAPANVTAEAASPAGAAVSYAACTATDIAGPVTLSYDIASGSTFPLGTTVVTCRAADAAGNHSDATFTITVRDTTPPSVTAPADQTTEATSAAGAAVAYLRCTANDIAGPVTLSYDIASGGTFSIGVTTVTCTATDGAGLSSSASFRITVRDTTPPTVTAPANQTAEATSAAGATVAYPPCTATDAASTPTLSYSKASGTTFPLGATTVTCTATDGAGLTSTATFTVTVRDTTPPTVTAPANQTAEATSAAGAAVTYPPCTAADIAGPVILSYDIASGSTFPLGATPVTCTATDGAGLTSSASFTVTVHDTIAPVVTAPADQTLEATSPSGAVATFACTATDAVSSPTFAYTPPSGSTFPLGTSTATCRATDAAGNHSDATFRITVRDTIPPGVTAPADQTAEATSALGAVVTYPPCIATDAASVPTLTYSKASGTTFPLGITTVTCTATDGAGLTSSATFTITVADTIAPTITGAATTAPNANGWYNANVTVHFTCSDAVGVTLCGPDATRGEGANQSVTGTARDAANNTSTFTVGNLNVDKTAPTIAFTGNLSYSVAQTVNITCVAADALSGLASSTCPGATGPASSFTLGTHTLTATATDRAGNVTTKSVTFTIGVTFTSLCDLTRALSHDRDVSNDLCEKLAEAQKAADRGKAKQVSAAITEYQRAFRDDDAARRAFTPANRDLLTSLAESLRPTVLPPPPPPPPHHHGDDD